MTRKLLIANFALVALAAAGLWRLRADWSRAQQRYQILAPAAKKRAAPAAEPSAPAPVQPAAFFDAADKFLFTADRNSTVAVEPPKHKPRPPLPSLSGVLNIGGGPIALMTLDTSRPYKPIRVGEKIGEFQLLAVAADEITLEWEGEAIHAAVSDLLARPAAAQPGQTAFGAASGASGASGAGQSPAAAVSTTETVSRPGEYRIGPAMQGANGTIYVSLPGDTAPHGTTYQGKRKVVQRGLMGTTSWWEDIK